jgi:hypothetical protein
MVDQTEDPQLMDAGGAVPQNETPGVFNRDVYANKDFWNDRFKE